MKHMKHRKHSQPGKGRIRFAMGPRILPILLMSFVVVLPVHAGTFPFPSAASTVVCGTSCSDSACISDNPLDQCTGCIGGFWKAGQQISQTFTDTLTSVTDLTLDIYVADNHLAAQQKVLWSLTVNGTPVEGSVEIDAFYEGELSLETSFPAIAGTSTGSSQYTYAIVFSVTNTVPSHDGAINLTNSGSLAHQITLSQYVAADADLSASGARFRVTKKSAERRVRRQCGGTNHRPCPEGGGRPNR